MTLYLVPCAVIGTVLDACGSVLPFAIVTAWFPFYLASFIFL